MNDRKIILGVIVMMALGTTAATLMANFSTQFAAGLTEPGNFRTKAPIAISGNNIYVAWWTNKSGNDEVIFRSSNDAAKTFSDKINLSNSTNAESQDVEISADGSKVVITWWERNQTATEPVMKMSTDGGKTFGSLLKLSINGTLGTEESKSEP